MVLAVMLLFVAPIMAFGAYQYSNGWPQSWNSADWSATGTAPDPAEETRAIIRIYAARTGRWKSIFAVHTWIAVKPENANQWTRYDVVGWGKPLRRNAYPVDGRWYSNPPEVIYELKGQEATLLIPKIIAQIARYPYSQRGDYAIWPGPNSNTFVATISDLSQALMLNCQQQPLEKIFLARVLWLARCLQKPGGRLPGMV